MGQTRVKPFPRFEVKHKRKSSLVWKSTLLYRLSSHGSWRRVTLILRLCYIDRIFVLILCFFSCCCCRCRKVPVATTTTTSLKSSPYDKPKPESHDASLCGIDSHICTQPHHDFIQFIRPWSYQGFGRSAPHPTTHHRELHCIAFSSLAEQAT
jgi:hypothetical protein